MQFTRENLKTLRTEIDAALLAIAQKHGFTMGIGSINFFADRFTCKIEARVVGAESEEVVRYRQNAVFYRLPELNSEVKLGCDIFLVRGMKSRGKNNILIERQRDGKSFVCPHTEIQLKVAPSMTLADFTTAVNALQKAEVDRINAQPGKLFGAAYHAYPEAMLAYYHKTGMTPQEAIDAIKAEAEAEGRAEALAS